MSIGISNNQKNLSFGALQSQKWKRVLKYIELTPSSPVSDAFVKEMASGIESIDGRVLRQILKVQNLKFKLAQKTSDAFPYLKGLQPRGWPKDKTWDNVGALSQGGKIGLFEKPIGEPTPSINAVRHEAGHELLRSFKKVINVDFDDTKGYTQAYLTDISKLYENMKKYGKKVKYADFCINYVVQGSTPKNPTKGGKNEAFAEIFAMLNGGSNQERDFKGMDKLYKQVFPETTAYVEKLLYLMGKR